MRGDEAMGSMEELRTTDDLVSMEPVKLNVRRRFWRWVLGYEAPLYTLEQMKSNVRTAINHAFEKEKSSDMIGGQRRFHIIDAMNGKIIRFSGPTGEELIGGVPGRGPSDLVRTGERYFVVPEGEDMLGAIARVLALDRVVAK